MRSGGFVLALAACGYSPRIGGIDQDGGGVDPDGTEVETDAPPDTPTNTFVKRINLGGAMVTGTDFAGTWAADPQTGGACPNALYWDVPGDNIKNTVDDALFVNHAYGLPTFSCAIAGIPSGDYDVTLVFGPTYYGAGCDTTAQQIFSINLEGTVVDAAFNLSTLSQGCVKSTGSNPAAHPVTRTFAVGITDGTLNLTETAPAGEAAMLSAIQIVGR